MKYIVLPDGKFAVLDDRDYLRCAKYKWRTLRSKKNSTLYAQRNLNKGEQGPTLLHRFVLGVDVKTRVDHKDGNGLNCQRKNLRKATDKQNGRNRFKQKDKCTSRFKGVSKRREGWVAYINKPGRKQVYLGLFSTQTEAAEAYNKAAKKLFGKFAKLNRMV